MYSKSLRKASHWLSLAFSRSHKTPPAIAKDAKTKAKKLIKDNRVNIITQADYQENSMIDKYIKALINKIEADNNLRKLEKKDN